MKKLQILLLSVAFIAIPTLLAMSSYVDRALTAAKNNNSQDFDEAIKYLNKDELLELLAGIKSHFDNLIPKDLRNLSEVSKYVLPARKFLARAQQELKERVYLQELYRTDLERTSR